MKNLLEDINALPVINKAENTWEGKKYKPVTLRLVELDKVIDLIKRNPVNDTIRDIITDLEKLSNEYRVISDDKKTEYVVDKVDLDAYIQQLEDRIL
jgi:ribosomal protein RSM22 (predicted rRNA methylase)